MSIRAKIIIFIIAILFAVRLWVNANLPLAPDEAHYWYWSQNLQMSYFDHPPMVAYMISLSTAIGGNNPFFVRFVGFLLMTLAHIFIFLTIKQLTRHGCAFAWDVILALNASLLFTIGCIIQTPDTPLVFFWCLGIYCGSRIFTGGSPRWWYLWGVALGLGMLSKYTMVLIVPCTVAFVILSPPHRKWLIRKEPYLAGFISFLCFLPVIYWNATHHWVSFGMQLNQGFTNPTDNGPLMKLLEYMGGQIGALTPLLFVSFFYYSLYGLIKSFRNQESNHLYLGLLCWPIILFFGYSSMRGEVAEVNWPAPAYIAGLLLASDVYYRYYREKKLHYRYVNIAMGLTIVLNILVCIHLVTPILPLTNKQDNSKQFHGWEIIAQTVKQTIANNPNDKGYFITANYGITTIAPMVFYTGNQHVGIDFARPEEYTFLSDEKIASLQGQNAVILINHYHPSRLEPFKPYFDKLRIIGDTSYEHRGESMERLELKIVIGENYQGNWYPTTAPTTP